MRTGPRADEGRGSLPPARVRAADRCRSLPSGGPGLRSGLGALGRRRLAPADALLDDDDLVERDVLEAVGLAGGRPVDLELDDALRLAEPHLLLEAVAAE